METDKWKEKGEKKKKEEDKPSFLSEVVRNFSWLANFSFSLYIIKNDSHIESCALNHFPLSTEGDLWCSLLPSWRNFNAYFSTVINILKKYPVSEYILPFQSRYTTCPLLSNLIWFPNSLCSAIYPTESWFHIYATIDVISFVTL